MELKICHLYPDVLNQSGDAGNISCFVQRLQARGIDSHVAKLAVGEQRSLNGFDLVLIGGGQELGQDALLSDLYKGRAADIKAAVEDGITLLAIDSGFELMGAYHEDVSGQRRDYIGVVDMYTREARERFTGNYIFSCPDCGDVIAFENHSGRTYLSAGLMPLGSIVYGNGNNGEDKTEGLHYKNLFGSYGHGPLLPKNPELCDLILKAALVRKYGSAQLQPLDDSFEKMAREEIYRRLA